MMINLIPPTGHKAIRKEYLLRIGAVYGMLFTIVAILLTVSLIPTYVLVRAQMQGAIEHSEEQAGDADITRIEDEIDRTEAIIAQLKKLPETTEMSAIIHEIEESAPAGIAFRSFTFTHAKNKLAPIEARGVAERREDLVAFKQTLETHVLFESASIPIADLARERDVPFSITIVLTEQKS